MPTRPRHCVLLIAGLAVMAACTAQPDQSPATPSQATTPPPAATTTTTTTSAARTFPQSTAFTPEQVCQLITADEAQSLSLEIMGGTTLFDAPECMFSGTGSRMSLSVDPRSLQAQQLSPEDKNTKTEISGRPALVIEDASKTTCGVLVALTTNTTLTAQGGRSSQDIEAHCQLARRTIDLALAKITK